MRIIISTFGSFGDVHPYLAIALELKRRGHNAVLATSEIYRAKIEAEGIEFFPVRPDLPAHGEAAQLIEKVMAGPKGARFLFEEILIPNLRDSYDDLLRAVQGADLLFSHVVPLCGPLAAQKTGVPWVSGVLAPISFFSAHDPSLPPLNAPLFIFLSRFGPRVTRHLNRIGEGIVEKWIEPLYQVRREIGLPRGEHPIFAGQHSPQKVLALFSPLLGAPQPDWPPQTVQTGFCFYDKRGELEGTKRESRGAIMPELQAFLNAGEAPIIFTLGSSAVMDAGTYFEESARAAQILKRRAVLLIGDEVNNLQNLPDGIAAFDYAPYSEIFPRASAIVHQGGVGTTAQAMRAGKPMLIMPFSHDQPDHAYRMQKLGIGRGIARKKYRAQRVAQELNFLLEDAVCAQRAAKIGAQIESENGTQKAADEIEKMF